MWKSKFYSAVAWRCRRPAGGRVCRAARGATAAAPVAPAAAAAAAAAAAPLEAMLGPARRPSRPPRQAGKPD